MMNQLYRKRMIENMKKTDLNEIFSTKQNINIKDIN